MTNYERIEIGGIRTLAFYHTFDKCSTCAYLLPCGDGYACRRDKNEPIEKSCMNGLVMWLNAEEGTSNEQILFNNRPNWVKEMPSKEAAESIAAFWKSTRESK